MKLQLIIIFLFLLGCNGNQNDVDNTLEIYSKAIVILENNEGFNNDINLKNSELSNIVQFSTAYTTELGLYLVQGESFASEYGLFIPRVDSISSVKGSADPSYLLIANHVYRYKIEG